MSTLLVSNFSANQTSTAVDCTSNKPVLVQAVVSGGVLTAGTLKAETSLDGTNYDTTTFPFSYAYGDINNKLVKYLGYGFPFMRFTLASLAFNYGKTQTVGTGLSDLTVGGTYTPLTAHEYLVWISDDDDAAVTASVTLNSTGVAPADGDTVVLGVRTYTFKDALTNTPAVKATTTLTSTGVAPTDGNTVTVGSVTYTFKDALTAPETQNEVLIDGTAAAALDNLKLAVNRAVGATNGKFGSDTVANPDLIATANNDTTQVFEALVAGAAGNALVSTVVGVTLSFPAVTWATPGTGADLVPGTTAWEVFVGASASVSLDNLKAAVDDTGLPGTDYGVGTSENATISASTKTATSLLFVADTGGVAGNSLVSTTPVGDELSFTSATFLGGLDIHDDKFRWSKDGGTPSAETIIVGGAMDIADGITVTWNATTGHTTGDTWLITPAAISVYMSRQA